MEPSLSREQFINRLKIWVDLFEQASLREQEHAMQTEDDWWASFAAFSGHSKILFTTGG